MGLRSLDFVLLSVRLYTSESDVHRRQILTYEDGPRAERINLYCYQANLHFMLRKSPLQNYNTHLQWSVLSRIKCNEIEYVRILTYKDGLALIEYKYL